MLSLIENVARETVRDSIQSYRYCFDDRDRGKFDLRNGIHHPRELKVPGRLLEDSSPELASALSTLLNI
jgi:hypothetical protein